MAIFKNNYYEQTIAMTGEFLKGKPLGYSEDAARISQWRDSEWHDWLRWRICRKGFDWSKPIWIGALVTGFLFFIFYGASTGKWFVTAGGVVVWFTAINLGFFTYFGLTLPGPPRTIPGPFPSNLLVRARMGIYPAGYERRKLARIWLRIPVEGDASSTSALPNLLGEKDARFWLFELPFKALPEDLWQLMKKQERRRIQGGAAPATDAIVETLPVTRGQIDAGMHPVRVVAWKWDEAALEYFDRTDAWLK